MTGPLLMLTIEGLVLGGALGWLIALGFYRRIWIWIPVTAAVCIAVLDAAFLVVS